jgi:transposase
VGRRRGSVDHCRGAPTRAPPPMRPSWCVHRGRRSTESATLAVDPSAAVDRGSAACGAKGQNSWQWGKLADRFGLPLAAYAASATPHESRLVAPTLDSRFVADLPRRLLGDRAYDADPLDGDLAKLGVEMIAPHRRNRKKPQTQDGRPLRRNKRRWKIERLFAWLGKFRRLVVRYERSALHELGFVQLGYILILLRRSL